MRGKLIVIDGIDGAGKTTQINLLAKLLKPEKIPFEIISFPQYGKNKYADYVYEYLSGKFGKISPYDLAKYYANDRLTVKNEISKWLQQGKLVIANRYISSSKAHLGAYVEAERREEFIRWIDKLEYEQNSMPREDVTILLQVDPKVGQKNSKIKDHPDLHEDNLSHLQQANKIFLELSKTEANWVVIDCMRDGHMRSPEVIHQEIRFLLGGQIF